MEKVYVLEQSGSDPSYNKGIVAICTTLEKAVNLLKQSFEEDVEHFKPSISELNIETDYPYYDISEDSSNAWITVEISEKYTNEFFK